MKKLVSATLCVVLLLLAAAGAVAEATPAGQFPISSERVTLKVAMPVNGKVEDINTNQLTLWLEDKLGIDLEFIELNTADTATQVNMIMTSGALPDVFIGYDFPYDTLASFVDAGLVLEMDELIEKYATAEGYNRFVNEFPLNNVEAYVTIDGHKYSIPSGSAMITDVYAGYASRYQKTFLKKLGLKEPATQDELYELLVAVRDGDPNGNGIADEIPMTSHITGDAHLNILRTIGNMYQYTEPANYVTVKDGKVEFIGNNQLFKETVQFMKKLVDEKLLEPAAFTQDESTLASRQLEESYLVGVFAVGNMMNCIDTGSQAYKDATGIMPALEGPYGYKATAYMVPTVFRASVITTACKNPDVAFRFLEFLLTEECSTAFRIGFEGSEWAAAEEGEMGRNGEQAKYRLLKPQEWIQPTTNVIWNMQVSTFASTMNNVYDGPDSTTGLVAQGLADSKLTETVVDEYLPPLLIPVEDSQEYNELRKMICDYVNQAAILFALGDKPMGEWDAYVAELDAMGVDRYVELTQLAYDAMFK